MRKQIMEILTEICPGVDFENEKALIDDGLIDSLDIVAVVTALSALYLALMPLIVRVKNTSTMIEQSSKRVDDAASLAENSKKQYEETSGEIRKNNETVAGFEGRLSTVEEQNREIISILKNGFCNMDEMVKKGYAEQIARIGNDGEGETDEADEAEK